MVTAIAQKNLADAEQRFAARLSRSGWVISCPKDTYGGPASGRLWQMTVERELKIVRNMNKAVFENR